MDTLQDFVERARWDALGDELRVDPPDLEVLVSYLEELNERLCKLFPDKSTNIRTCIDIPFIQQLVDNHVFGNEELVPIVFSIISLIGSSVQGGLYREFRRWEAQIHDVLESGNVIMWKFVPTFLRNVNQWLDRVEFSRLVNHTLSNMIELTEIESL